MKFIAKKDELLVLSYIISSIGNWIFMFSMPLYIYHVQGSALSIAIGYTLTFLPFLLFTLPAGVLADKMQKKLLLCVLDIFGFFLCLMLFFIMKGNASISIVYLFIFAISSLNTMYHVVFQGSLPLIFSSQKLPLVNGTIRSAESILSSLGPILGVMVSSTFGYSYGVLFNGSSFFLSFLLIMAFTRFTSHVVKEHKILKMLRDGIHITLQEPFIRFGAFLFFWGNFSLQFFLALFIYYLKDTLHLSDVLVAIVYSIGGLGSIIGSFCAKSVVNRFSPKLAISLCVLLSGFFLALISINNFALIVICNFFLLFFGSMNVVIFFTERQRRVSSEILSRVVSVSRLIAFASIPMGAMVGGYFANFYSISVIILAAGLYRIILGIWAYKVTRKL